MTSIDNANTPGLTPHKAMKAAKKRRNIALHKARQGDPANVEEFKRADADYAAARDNWTESVQPGAKQMLADYRRTGLPPKRIQ